MQTLAVIVLIGAAAYFVVRRFLGLLKGGGSPCGCCPDSESCSAEKQAGDSSQLKDHRPNRPS